MFDRDRTEGRAEQAENERVNISKIIIGNQRCDKPKEELNRQKGVGNR